MVIVKRNSLLKAGLASLAFAAVALAFTPTVKAQAMGEYGLAVGHSAGAAAAAPHADLPSIPATSAQSGSSGTTTTERSEKMIPRPRTRRPPTPTTVSPATSGQKSKARTTVTEFGRLSSRDRISTRYRRRAARRSVLN